MLARCRSLAEAGIQHFIFSIPNAFEIEPLKILERHVIPAVAEL
jgi:hypothetical protein